MFEASWPDISIKTIINEILSLTFLAQIYSDLHFTWDSIQSH